MEILGRENHQEGRFETLKSFKIINYIIKVIFLKVKIHI